MIIASLFGTSAGLEVYRNPIGEATSLTIDDAWIDISPDDIKLRGDSDAFCIFRRQLSGKTITWVGLYRSATEIGANRPGGFYGAGLWLVDCAVSSSAIYEVVTNLANQVKELAINNGKFVKKISEIRSSIVPPPQVKALLSGKAHISCGLSIDGGGQAFITDPQNAIGLIEWAQNSSAAELFRKIIVASPDQFVQQKSQYLAGFERFQTIEAAADAAFIKRNSLKDEELRKLDIELSLRNKELAQKNNEINTISQNLKNSQADLSKFRSELSKSQTEMGNLRQKIQAQNIRAPSLEGNRSAIKVVGPNGSKTSAVKTGYSAPANSQYEGHEKILPNSLNGVAQRSVFEFFKNIVLLLLIIIMILIVSAVLINPNRVLSIFFSEHLSRIKDANKQEITALKNDLKESNEVALKTKNENLKLNNQIDELTRLVESVSERREVGMNNGRVYDNLKDSSEKCNLDLQKVNYTIVINSQVEGTPGEPKRPEIFNQIISGCKADFDNKFCTKTLSKIKDSFVGATKVYQGQVVLPKGCAVPITHVRDNKFTVVLDNKPSF